MFGVGELGGDVQCKLVPVVSVSLLLVGDVSLHSRLRRGAAYLVVGGNKYMLTL